LNKRSGAHKGKGTHLLQKKKRNNRLLHVVRLRIGPCPTTQSERKIPVSGATPCEGKRTNRGARCVANTSAMAY